MVSFLDIKDKRQLPILVIGCISVFMFLYFLNRDIARIGVYLLAFVGLYKIYKDGINKNKERFLLISIIVFVVVMLAAFYMSNICCSETDYYSKPFVHLLVMYPFILLNIFVSGWIRWLLNASLLFIIVGILAYTFSDYPLHSAKYFESHYALYLLMAPIAYMMYHSKLQAKTIFTIFIVSGIVIGFAAVADLTGFARTQLWPFDEYSTPPDLIRVGVGASINSIHFAIITVAVLAVVVTGFCMTASKLSKVKLMLAILSILLLVFALVTSGARSAWISIPLVFVIPFIYSSLSIKVKISIFILLLLSLVLVLQFPYVQNRLRLIPEEISKYMGSTEMADSVRSTTSIGVRLELWRAAWEVFLRNPILGVGPGNFRNYMQEVDLGSSGRYHKEVETHRNPHSLYFKALAERGLLGILTVLVMLVLPGLLFLIHTRKSNCMDVRVYAISGLLVVIVYSLGGLTIGSLHKSELSIFYIFFIALFSGLMLSSKNYSKVSN